MDTMPHSIAALRWLSTAPGPPTKTAAIPDNIREQQIARIPLKRTAQPEDIARVHLFLVSDESGYITGQTIVIDGGMENVIGSTPPRID